MAFQSWGYGTSEADVDAFLNAESPYGSLAQLYVGALLRDVLNLAASISLFAILLGTVAGAARILYALARDAGGRGGVARLSRSGEPVIALVLVLAVVAGAIVGQRLAGSAVLDATFYALTVGTLCLLVAYLLATAGAIRFLFLGERRRSPVWQVVVPVAGMALVGYTLYKNVFGLDEPYSRFPFIVGVWLLAGAALVAFVPGVAARVRQGLATSGAAGAEEPARA
jgi:amino acid transporter